MPQTSFARMSRRRFVESLGAAALGWNAAQPAEAQNAPEWTRPNVVLILADDMGFSDLGCYGGEIATPHLDALGRAGVRFSHFYNTARCSPSRASLLTGLHPHQAGFSILTNDDQPRGYPGNLNRACATLAEVLRDAG